MSDKDRIRSLLKEAELYKKQSLLTQSKDKYFNVLQIIESSRQLGNREKLMDAVREKMRAVEKKLTEIDEAPEAPELSESQHNLIRKRFSFSKDKDKAAIEGAVALAKFGQYEQALAQFKKLLKQGVLPVVVAKNIITCLLSFSTADAAVAQFSQWVSRESLSRPQLKQILAFLNNTFEKKGIKVELPKLDEAPAEAGKEDEEDDAVLDLSSISIQLESGPLKGETVEFDVTFQSGNSVSVIIPARRKDLLDSFKTGMELSDIQCFSPIGFFRANGVLFGKTEIKDGPKQGDYLLEIAINAD
jgi:tetratricopeptide (TPR) repeat protein